MANTYKDYFDKAQQQTGVRKRSTAPVLKIKKPARGSKNKKNPAALILTFMGFLITLGGAFYLDEVVLFVRSVDVSFMSQAGAQENNNGTTSNKNAVPGAENEKKSAETSTIDNKGTGNSEDEMELNHLARLRERKIELDKREADIAKMEEELAEQQKEVEAKLKELETVRRQISSTLEERVQIDDQKVQDLVQFYSNMKPPQAAEIMAQIEEPLAVLIIGKMKKQNAANILNLLKPEKAKAISEKYAGYRK